VESQTHLTSKTTPRQIDYLTLYEAIGDLVIEGAHSGDPIFEKIYQCAWNKTKGNFIEQNNNAGSNGREPAEPAAEATPTTRQETSV
jgi:predicted NUDIX family NTP pyrophosphohydrolase